jgi:integrase
MRLPSETALDRHDEDLAGVCEALASNCSKLLVHEGPVSGNVVDGGILWQSTHSVFVHSEVTAREDGSVLEPVDDDLARGALQHLAAEFPEMSAIGDWRDLTRESLDEGIVKTLRLAARRRAFAGYCDICATLHSDGVDTGVMSRSQAGSPPAVRTRDVIESLLSHKKHKRAKESSIKTYRKHYDRFEREFPWMPETVDPILEYLARFDGESGRTRRNQHDDLGRLYRHAVRFHEMKKNPMEGLERPLVTKQPVRSLSLDQVRLLDQAVETPVERVALDLLLGHGWRQVEVRRIEAADVFGIQDGIIWCRGKEREEWAPILPETEERLRALAEGRGPAEQVILSRRTRGGLRQPLGESGMWQLVAQLYARAGITGMKGHDLRRSFATLATEGSGDEFLAMRLLRDKVAGQSDRYVRFSSRQMKQGLERYSPLRVLQERGASVTRMADPSC